MSREEILGLLSRHRTEMARRFGVKRLAIFGSVARGESRNDSDIDMLVAFEKPPGFNGYMDLKFFLEDLLGRRVDLVMEGALRPDLRSVVEAEAVHVA